MLDPNDHVLDYVDAYLHDLLTAERRRDPGERHCATCKICQVAMEEARRRLEAMQTLPVVEAPESLIQRRPSEDRPIPAAAADAGSRGLGGCRGAAGHVRRLARLLSTLGASRYDLRILGQSELVAESAGLAPRAAG